MEDERDYEPKDVRIQFLLTGSEAEKIAAWGAQNRLRSKAEAVRQLCEIGLEAHSHADAVEEQKHHLVNIKRRAAREIVGIRTRLKDAESMDERCRLLERSLSTLTEILTDLVLATADISTTATRVFAPAITRRSNPDIERALYEAGWTVEPDEEEESDDDIRKRLLALSQLQSKAPRKED